MSARRRCNVRPPPLQRPPKLGEFLQTGGDTGADGVDQTAQNAVALLGVGVGVSAGQSLIHRPCHFHRGVVRFGECFCQTGSLAIRQQRLTGAEGASGPIQRIAGAAPVPTRVLLHPLPAQIQLRAGERDDMERIHDRDRLGDAPGGGGLVTTEPVHGQHLHPSPERRCPLGEPPRQRRRGSPRNQIEQPGRPGAVDDQVRSTMTVTKPSPAARRVCAQRCSSTPTTRTPSKRVVSAATSAVVASTAMVLTVSHDGPSSRAITATVVRSSISRRRTYRAQRRVVDHPVRAR